MICCEDNKLAVYSSWVQIKFHFYTGRIFRLKKNALYLVLSALLSLNLSEALKMLPFLVLVSGKGSDSGNSSVLSGIAGGGRTGPESGLLLTVPSANRIYKKQRHIRG